jgi:amidase
MTLACSAPIHEDVAMTVEPWLKTSIMAKRGVARGEAGKRHELPIAAQGDFHYVYGPYAKPVLTINPGDIVAVETEVHLAASSPARRTARPRSSSSPFLTRNAGRLP